MESFKTAAVILLFLFVAGVFGLFFWPPIVFGFITFLAVGCAKEKLMQRKYVGVAAIAIVYSLFLSLIFNKCNELLWDLTYAIALRTTFSERACYTLAELFYGLILFATILLAYIIYCDYQKQKKA